MKKATALLLSGVMTCSLLAGCSSGASSGGNSGSDGGDGKTAETEKTATQSAEETAGGAQTENGGSADDSASEGNGGADGEIYEVVMAMPILGAEPPGMQAVEDAINAVTEPEIGVHLTMYPIFVNDLASQQNLMITSGDKLDLAMIFVTGVGTYVNKGALLPLDDLYTQYGQDIEAAEGIAMAGGYFNGNLYAVPSEEKWARSYGFYARTDILEELGMSFDPDTIYTYDDLTELFKAYKDKYGDGYYCISGTNATTDLFQYWDKYDTLGSTLATGVLMGAGLDGDTTVTNVYTTDEYKAYAQKMYEWAQAGYFSPDAATNTDAGTVQIQSGYYLGGFGGTETDMQSNMSRDCGYDMTKINLVDKYATTSMYQTSMWAIPATCENPEKTFQFLNYLYADNDLDNMLTYGLEGTSYEVVDAGEKKGQGVIRYADGVDAANTPYNMPLHVFGDKTSISVFEPLTLDYYKVAEEWNSTITDEQKSCTLGYVFDTSPVSTQKTAVDAVVSQYTGLVACGTQDPETLLPEFNQALEAAGINDIIEENQRQLDEWLAAQK